MSAHNTSGSRHTRNSRKMSLSPIGGSLSPVHSEVEQSPAHSRTSSPQPSPDSEVLATIVTQLQQIQLHMTGIDSQTSSLMTRITSLEGQLSQPSAPAINTPLAAPPPSQQPGAPHLTNGFMTPPAEPQRIISTDPPQEESSTSPRNSNPRFKSSKAPPIGTPGSFSSNPT